MSETPKTGPYPECRHMRACQWLGPEGVICRACGYPTKGTSAVPAETAPPVVSDGIGARLSHRFDCDECHVRGVIVDEDGCCQGCGHDARRVQVPVPPVPPVRETAAPALTCCACGAVNQGGYEAEDVQGVYCRDCWDDLREHFQRDMPPAAPDLAGVRARLDLLELLQGAAVTCESTPGDRRVVIRFGESLECAQALFVFLTGSSR